MLSVSLLFLQGLELSIFPLGKSLANQFARKGSLWLLISFGFAIGFSAVIAEPALIAIAEQAEVISDGKVNALSLRLLVAISVGFVISLGVFRTIMGYPLHWFMIIGYISVVLVTYFSPLEIVGLAYDSGGVTTNIVTVPLIAAIGIGLASSIKGRNPIIDGFGLVALAVMVPMITVQLYGIYVYSFKEATVIVNTVTTSTESHSAWLTMFIDLLTMMRDVMPIILTVLFFQYLVLKRGLSNPLHVSFGFFPRYNWLICFCGRIKARFIPYWQRYGRATNR